MEETKITGDLSPHLINIILHLQDLNSRLKSLDASSVENMINDFKAWLNLNLANHSANMVETNKALTACDMAKFSKDISRLEEKIDNLETKICELLDRNMSIKLVIDENTTIKKTLSTTQSKFIDEPIDEINLSVRALNAIRSHYLLKDISKPTIKDLVRLTESQLLRGKNMGRKTFSEIKKALTECGLSLGMSLD